MTETKLKEIVESLDGWCSYDKASTLHNLVLEEKPNLIVELGVYGGRSLVPMALAQIENKKGTIIGIDPWLAEASLEGAHSTQSIGGWGGVKNTDYSYIYERCVNKIIEYNLNNCELIRMKSQEAISLFVDNSIDVLHQDGNHSEDLATIEVELYMQKLKSGGYWISDDIHFDTIKKSLLLIKEHCDLVYENLENPFAIFKKR